MHRILKHKLVVGATAVALVGQAAFVPNASLPLYGGTGSFGLQGTALAQSFASLVTPGGGKKD